MAEGMYPAATREVAAHRAELAPEINEAFENFSRAVFAEGALPEKTKQLIAVAVAHVTQCPYCITGHTKLARRKGARPEEIMEAIFWAMGQSNDPAHRQERSTPGTREGGDDPGARATRGERRRLPRQRREVDPARRIRAYIRRNSSRRQRSSPTRWSRSRSTAAVPGRAGPARRGGRAPRAAR